MNGFYKMNFLNFYDYIFPAEPFSKFFKAPNKIKEELKHFKKSESVLEIGTAEAYIIRELIKKKAVMSAVGYDISKIRLNRAQKRIDKNGLKNQIKLILGNGTNLPFEDKTFDVVILPQILEHISNKKDIIKLLKESYRVSKYGLLISLPLRDSENFWIRWSKYIDPDHIKNLVKYKNGWIYNAPNVEKLFKEIGFIFNRSDRYREFFYVFKQ